MLHFKINSKIIKNIIMKKKLLIFLLPLSILSCSDLKEEELGQLYREDIEDLLDDPSQDFLARLTSGLYSPMVPNFTERLLFNLQETTTDEVIVPTRFSQGGGSDWYDGGRYVALHTHTWTPEEVTLTNVFNNLQKGIAGSLEVLDILSSNTESQAVKASFAEAQGLLAFYSFYMFDLYGQIPYIDISTSKNVVLFGDDAVNEIDRLLTEAIPYLTDKSGSRSGTKFNKSAAQILLAKLNLNKAVYRDRYADSFTFTNSEMNAVINYSTTVINEGGYSLAPDYFRLFDGDNDNNSATNEIIFAADLQAGVQGNRAFIAMTLSQGVYAANSGGFRGWNGFATLPEFVDTWDVSDPRYFEEHIPQKDGVLAPKDYQLNRGIQIGVQYGAVPVNSENKPSEKGNFRTDANGNYVIEVLRNFIRDNKIIDYTKEVTMKANQEAGARVYKYGYDVPGPGRDDTNMNIPLIRLADAYLMRAEAKLRNGDAFGAMADLNYVRTARGAKNITLISLDILLKERGFEFYWEQQRRTDLIRFSKFNNAYTEKPITNANYRVFPIPRNALAASLLLKQNKGY
jgi:hypothetical protein